MEEFTSNGAVGGAGAEVRSERLNRSILIAVPNNAEQIAKILNIASKIDMDWVNSEDVDFEGLAYMLGEIRAAYDKIN